ncbi:autotransporter domain-containing protein [Aliarcobacter cryaerophilus]|uniref:autotransporter family protein n=1 Tax=Aliarcobacter cryaerophilus TaxID=28198 RepID=UPI0021B60810|nr:autotransporter outer membrane beta-barrel domain-containing protein [Aliarcobacter cryaerophilus]MCT7509845.1 autotransporter domain-containing protein [Aliarcobacter cryaerophilus]
MINRYIDNLDYKSRFRILKGGKVSLVVSAIIVGCVVNFANAANAISSPLNSTYNYIDGDVEDTIITSTGSISVSGGQTAININTKPLASDKELQNNGTISILNGTGASAIFSNQIIYGTINNFGTISSTQANGGAAGINIFSLNQGIIENKVGGTITASSTSGASFTWGIYANSLTDGGTSDSAEIINNGVINASSIKDSFGIINSNLLGSNITNNGNLNVNGTSGDTLTSIGIYIGNKSDRSNDAPVVTNSGTMTIRSNAVDGYYSYASSYGIYVNNALGSYYSNTGTIDVLATSNVGDTEARALAYGMNFGTLINNSHITNDGTIKVVANAQDIDYSYGEAYGIKASASDSTITNNGDILVEAYGKRGNVSSTKATGIFLGLETVSLNATLATNTAKIIAKTISLASNTEAYGVQLNTNRNNNFTFINEANGVIEAYHNSELGLNAYSLSLSSGGNVIATNRGILKGNLNVNGTLTNSGLIELSHYKNDGKNDAYAKNFINEANGKLKIGLLTDGTIGNTKYSQLNTQSAVFNDGSTIDVNVLSASTNQPLLAGKRLENVVTATTALTINDKLNITDNSALLNFKYVTSDGWINGGSGAIHLDVVKSSENNIIDNTVSGGGNKNSQNAATALQNVYNSNPEIQSAFNNLTSAQEVASAVQSTTALTPTATVGATTQISNGIAGIVTQRQNANISGGGLNSGDTMFAQKNFWFKPFGSLGSQKDKDGISGFDVKAGGFGLGLDGEYKDNQNIGFGLFYTNANVDVNNVNQKADLDVFTTLLYGNVPVIDDKTNFLYQVGYSWQKIDGSREIFTGQTATSDYTSKTASLDLKLMRDVQITDNLLLQPMVETTYRHFTNPAYKENGAGALNLNVDKFTSKDLIVGLGTIAHYKLTDDSKIVGNVNVGYDFESKNQTVTSAFQGAAGVKFDTNGIDNGRWSYQAGIGYELDINKTNSINVSYDYQGQGSDFSNNTVSAKYVLKF